VRPACGLAEQHGLHRVVLTCAREFASSPVITAEQIAARNAARCEESERAYYKERHGQRAERGLKEGREALERGLRERNRRAGWA
jgi:hypothetical protein